ncbi:putative F-box/FBD/LRR-repeat protein At1g78760 [Primulina huaijiensis]|uniref:putative F-box/FBD/LRR-repeat protein At1g78760 n=1 Tax=Primulina huaijiensis TaxID=1492673 RepID=UPI003CC73323
MFWKKIALQKLLKSDHSTKKPRIIGPNLKLKKWVGKRKLDCRSVESNNDRTRKKQRMIENNGPDDIPPEVDRISELPEPIVHHIFAHLRCPKDVVRTCIWSKKWKGMFNSYLTFDFDERCFGARGGKRNHSRLRSREVQKRKFNSYVDKSIVSRLAPAPCIDKFRLYISNLNYPLEFSMKKWINLAVQKNVKVLEIHVNSKERPYNLPCDVLASKAITSLKLSGSVIPSLSSLELCNLRELSLKGTTVIELLIKKVGQSCPLLEDLRLVGCTGLFSLNIPSLTKLRRVEVHECASLTRIEIMAPNLETFWYHARKHQYCGIVFKGCGTLKNLTLRDCRMTDTVFQNYISKCPLIENLVLQECSRVKRLTILSAKLKSLALLMCTKIQEVNIDAPNLYAFQFSSHRMPFSSMNVSGLCEVKFSFGHTVRMPQIIDECKKIFGNMDRSKGFKLVVHTKQTMKIYEDLKEVDLVQDSFSKLDLTLSSLTVVNLVDKWLSESHGRILTLISPGSELVKLIRMMIVNREDDSNCCSFYSKKCWRHYLADVQMMVSKFARNTFYVFKWKGPRLM